MCSCVEVCEPFELSGVGRGMGVLDGGACASREGEILEVFLPH